MFSVKSVASASESKGSFESLFDFPDVSIDLLLLFPINLLDSCEIPGLIISLKLGL